MTRFIWLISWPIYRLFLFIFFRFEIDGRENLKNIKKPFIVAANHASFLDGEILSVAFPWNSEFFPIHFAAAKYYWDKPILGWILKILGNFPVVRGIDIDKSLSEAVALIKKGEAVAIFPEGRKTQDGNLGDAKPGISYLALKTNSPILPIGVSGTFGLNPKKILFFERRKIKVNFGEPFYLKDFVGSHNPDPDKDYEILIKGAQIIMDKIKGLV